MLDVHKKSLLVAIIAGLLLVILWLGVIAHQRNRDANAAENLNNELDQLLLGYDAGVEGRSCGVLQAQLASTYLEAPAEKDEVASRQRAGGTAESTPGNAQLFWSDTCIYEDVANSGRYVELNISTYQTEDEAADAYERVLPVVNEAEVLDAGSNGQQLQYDAGVLYLLNDRQIIRVSASNGNPALTKQFSLQVYEDLLPRLN